MLTRADIKRLLAYTLWANHRILRAAAQLSSEDFRRSIGSSHGGVRGTFTHMLFIEWLWLERFKGLSPGERIEESDFSDIIDLRNRWRVIEDHRSAWFGSLKDTDLREPVRYGNSAGKMIAAPLGLLVQHMVNHSTYHRGQVVTLLRFLGARPVATDFLVWDREQAVRSQAHHKSEEDER
ncbi:MAG: damage-inducible protein DinB [Vicinamibacteria bacterium]|jgi:uncharacterized damage-inducible protein DinB|nr:damage-inducible protein DinB [Vicinamibacteria bacterium]